MKHILGRDHDADVVFNVLNESASFPCGVRMPGRIVDGYAVNDWLSWRRKATFFLVLDGSKLEGMFESRHESFGY